MAIPFAWHLRNCLLYTLFYPYIIYTEYKESKFHARITRSEDAFSTHYKTL